MSKGFLNITIANSITAIAVAIWELSSYFINSYTKVSSERLGFRINKVVATVTTTARFEVSCYSFISNYHFTSYLMIFC